MERDDLNDIPILGLNNYKITSEGRIWSNLTKRFLKDKITNGYKSITFRFKEYNNYKTKTFAIHRLVALVFIKNPKKYPYVNHINENKLDNRIENLEWITQKENVLKSSKNTSHPRRVLLLGDDGINILYESLTEASKDVKLSRSAISKACLGLNKTAGGYKWKYLEDTYNHTKIDYKDSKIIKGYNNYLIFSDGRIYSIPRKKYLKPIQNASGYTYVTLCTNNKKKNYYIHRLVAEHFLIKSDNNLTQVNHKNSIKNDNNFNNLEWVTASENMIHMFKTRN